ncbi:MAG: PEGA domain-containing protein [Deltaproteobacteria bacterium]|nr:PEGA domain-containing protein [Deltaproteobacteria bacterium]
MRDAPADASSPADAAAPAPAGLGKLLFGAEPWADVYIDGIKRGITPIALDLTVGRHTIELVFGGEDPPRRKRFERDVRLGDNEPVHANFNQP